MTESLRVLLVDDSSDDALLILDAISEPGLDIVSRRVEDAAGLRDALEAEVWDVVVGDYALPHLTGEEALRIVMDSSATPPFILVSGVIGEDAAVGMMRAGALDYVMKDRLGRLLPAIRREVREVELRRARSEVENEMAKALLERDERYRQIVDTAQEGIWTIDTASRTTFVNPRMSEMLGYSAEEMLGRPLSDFIHPGDAASAAEYTKRRREGLSDDDDFVLRAKDGRSIHIHFKANPLHGRDGAYIGSLAMVTDVTARWNAEVTVLRQKKELEEAQRIAHIGSWRRDLRTHALEWSDELYRIFGIDPSIPMTVETLLEAVVPEDRARVATMIRNAAERGLAIDGHYRIVRPDGTLRTVHVFAEITPDADGAPLQILGVTQDITDRVAAAAAHETVSHNLKLLLESTSQGIFGVDGDMRCTFINRAASESLGYAPGELVGTSMRGIIRDTEDGPGCSSGNCRIEMAARSGAASEVHDGMLARCDGTLLPVEYSAAPIIDSGSVEGVVCAFTDVSERKLLQAQLEQSERVSSLGRLAATMAHEFNNVLMGIQPFAELLSRQGTRENVHRATHNILQAVQRGRSITDGILQFARPVRLMKATIDVRHWLASMEAMLQAVAGEGVQLRLRVAGQALFIRADRHQLEQIMTNLAANARDAMSQHGELSVTAERCMSGFVFPFGAIRTPDQYLHLSVSDTGGGMDPKTLKAIFDPFFTTKRAGTGLGLAVVHRVVELHGGSIVAESVVGEGTTFHIFLPLSQEAFEGTEVREAASA